MVDVREVSWVAKAREYVGVREYVGPKHNPLITAMLPSVGAWWNDDDKPWCGTFVGHILKLSNRYVVSMGFRAKAWLKAGTVLEKPAYGCLVVFSRKGGGHVGFVVGINKHGQIMVLGGNQGNKVSIIPFSNDRPRTYIWPSWASGTTSIPFEFRYKLPLLDSTGQSVSENEA